MIVIGRRVIHMADCQPKLSRALAQQLSDYQGGRRLMLRLFF
jgi:hypothetical protein